MKVKHIQLRDVILLAWLAIGLYGSAEEAARPALHDQIDALIAEGNVAPVAPHAGETTFVRRLYLDLCGRIPGVEEVRSFLADSRPDKHALLVDRLLNSRENTLHLARALDVWFMERRRDEQVKDAEWLRYLVDSMAGDKPCDQLVREILSADGTDEAIRPASRFYLDRKGEPHLLTRDVGRIFFGKDLQCAQCHDHPNIDDYLQRDYYGLFAFFNRTSFFQPDTKKPALLAESAEGEATFKSVFTGVQSESLPRVPGGTEIPDPELKPEEAYKVKPDKKNKNVRPVPTYSRRVRLATAAMETTHRLLARNAANRLWKQMMGKGLVEPVDYHHPGNPPSHPELLDLLTDAFVEMKYDIRSFLRELALSETYRRAIELEETLVAQAPTVQERIPSLQAEAERLMEAASDAAEACDAEKETWEEAAKQLSADSDELAKLVKEREQAEAARKKAAGEADKIRKQLADHEAKLKVLREADEKAQVAVKALPEDKELAEAAAKFTGRATQLEGKATSVRASLEPKETALREALEALEKATVAVAEQQNKTDAAAATVASAASILDEARVRRRAERTAAINAKRLLEDARQWVDYARARTEAVSSREEAARLTTELTALESETDRARTVAADLAEASKRVESVVAMSAEDLDLGGTVEVLQDRSRVASERADAAVQELEQLRSRTRAAQTRAGELGGVAEAALEALTGRWTQSFALGVFEPLTPEQLCSSMMEASGYLGMVKAQGESEFDKKMKAQEEAIKKQENERKGAEGGGKEKKKETPPERTLSESDRAVFVEAHVREKTRSAFNQFTKLFGGQPGQPQTEFYATADQALYLANNGLVRGWLRPSGDNLTARLGRLEDPAAMADELYLAVLTREPAMEEVHQVSRMLDAMPEEKPKAVEEMAWALMSSVEFRFRH